jgi:hypothetical protein
MPPSSRAPEIKIWRVIGASIRIVPNTKERAMTKHLQQEPVAAIRL